MCAPAPSAIRPETRKDLIRRAEIRLPTRDLDGDLGFLVETLGFRLERIWPADNPAFCALSGHGTAVLLERNAERTPVTLRLYADSPGCFADGVVEFTSPGGHRVVVEAANPPLAVPRPTRELVVRHRADGDSWVAGRAGMRYRDLIPGRLGGAVIASHIRIPEGGPVRDLVHFHSVRFQLIFCHRGWVRVVYEDQGPPFVLGAGDCVIQPPEIRHQVLEASAGAEVIEIGVPANHLTTVDHAMELPTPHHRPEREFQGTRFARHREAEAVWTPGRVPGFEARETGIGSATKGVAGVRIARRIPGARVPDTRHRADILFVFLREGALTLRADGQPAHRLAAGDAFVTPPGLAVSFENPSDALEVLEVALPAAFETEVMGSSDES